jgi:sRNA-binding carbon storage regulator CsrA
MSPEDSDARVLTLGAGDAVVVGDSELVVVEVLQARARIGIRAAVDVPVMRGEADPDEVFRSR